MGFYIKLNDAPKGTFTKKSIELNQNDQVSAQIKKKVDLADNVNPTHSKKRVNLSDNSYTPSYNH